jgi:hypothetical protein
VLGVQGRSNRVWLAVVTACILASVACGRAPVSNAPSPSADVSTSPATISPSVTTPSSTPPKGGVPTPSKRPPSPTPTSRTSPSTAPPPAPVTINKFSFHAGEVRILYTDVVLSASGGKPPYSWSVSGGAVPGGLALSPSGTMSGTPAAAGGFPFTLHVADSKGTVGTAAASITIAPLLSIAGSCSSSPCQVEAGCTICGNFGSLSGGVGPFTYVPQGTLPTGMGISALNMTGPFPAGSYKFGVGATDSLGAKAFVPVAYDVFPHIAFTVKTATCSGSATKGCVARLTYAAGTPGGTPTVRVTLGTAPPLPKGFRAVASAGVVTITFPAMPLNAKYTYSGIIGVTLTDQGLCGPAAGQLCTSRTVPVNISIIAG